MLNNKVFSHLLLKCSALNGKEEGKTFFTQRWAVLVLRIRCFMATSMSQLAIPTRKYNPYRPERISKVVRNTH